MLSESVDIDSVKKVVLIPKVSLLDFTTASHRNNRKSITSASNVDCLKQISYYLKKDDKILVDRLLSEYSNLTVKFKAPSFKCRVINIMIEEDKNGSNNFEEVTDQEFLIDLK